MEDDIKELLYLLHSDRLSDCGKRKLESYITNLQERCEYLQRSCERKEDEIMSLRDECVDGETYKSRIDKAVEYIENDLKSFLYSIEYKTLLNILQGSDKE